MRRIFLASVMLSVVLAHVAVAGARPRDLPREALSVAKALENLYETIAENTLASMVQVMPTYGPGPAPEPADFADPLEAFRHFYAPDGAVRKRMIGSGFAVEVDGRIVTAAHGLRGVGAVFVRLSDDTIVEAEISGKDDELDIAVLQIEPGLVSPLAWGDSGELRPGSIVFAMGHPFGFRNSVSQGIVSGLGRRYFASEFLQTDTEIAPGNSGGPMVNLDGEVVGITTWILTPGRGSNLGFAIPSNLAREVVDRLLRIQPSSRAAPRPWLGFVHSRIENGGRGVDVSYVVPGSPAHGAGLRGGDRIVAVDGMHVETPIVLREMLRNLRPGQRLDVEIAGRDERLPLTVGERPTDFRAVRAVETRPVPRGDGVLPQPGAGPAEEHGGGVGDAPDEPATDLNAAAPVTAFVWFDYTDPQGRKLVRMIESISKEYAPLVSVYLRYHPKDPENPLPWRRTVAAVEIARANGRYAAAHAFLLDEDGLDWEQKLGALPGIVGLDANLFRPPRDADAVRRDASDDSTPPPREGVQQSPSLEINGVLLVGPFDARDISEQIEHAVLGTML